MIRDRQTVVVIVQNPHQHAHRKVDKSQPRSAGQIASHGAQVTTRDESTSEQSI